MERVKNGYLRNERLYESNYNNQGELMTIIEYYNANNLIVLFDKTNKTKKCAYREFKNGSVTDNFYPSVCGIGYVGDTTIVKDKKKVKDSYSVWANMIFRCHSPRVTKKHIAYVDCSVCEEWLCYANFEKWYNDNFYSVGEEKMQLDKDIIVKNNKLYSPHTCIFVPQRINSLLTKRKMSRGKYPIGVTYSKKVGKFEPQVQGCGWLGYYDTPEEAFYVYKENKEKLIKKMADSIKEFIPIKLYNALYNYRVEITD